MNSNRLACLIFGLTLLTGCDHRGPGTAAVIQASTTSAQSIDPEITLKHDAGIVDGDVEHNFEIPWTTNRVVESVSKGCGCTVANVAPGDSLVAGSQIKMQVSTAGKTSGNGGQSLLIKFVDGGTCQCQLKYDYRQPPFVAPKYLVFRPSQAVKEIDLRFPGVPDAELLSIEKDDPCLNLEVQKPAATVPDKIVVKMTYDYGQPGQAQERQVIFKARASSKEFSLRLSYLALHNE